MLDQRICSEKARVPSVLLLSVITVMLAAVPPAVYAFDPLNGDYSRDDALDVRVVTYNHYGKFITDSSRDAAFDRILTALDADIICFQEFPSSVSVADVENRMNSIIPIGGAGWQIHFGLLGGIRTVIASRYSLSMTRIDTIPTSSTRGVTIALADLPDADYPVDVYLLGVHLKAFSDESSQTKRRISADAIANWLGDARGVARPSGDNVVLGDDTPMINLGDFNLVGGPLSPPLPIDTLLTGDIFDEATYGTDVKGDWDNSDMTDLTPTDPFTGDDFTWQGNETYPPSRLDRFLYTDSVVTVANSFILNTDTMSPAALAAAGLLATDTLRDYSSDHLPLAMDIRFGPECNSNGDCDDASVCTQDTCNTNGECEYVNSSGVCDDGLFCTLTDICSSGACVGSGDPCQPGETCFESTDTCDTVECIVDGDCDDSNTCTVDTCVGGVCYNECASTVSSYPYAEGFESGWGAWVNAAGDDMDWTRNSGSTPSSSTGPSGAHGGSYYVYTEASSPNYPDKTAILEGPCFDLANTSDADLTFWYHMYGSAMGTLNVGVSGDCTSWANVWNLSGDQGDLWYQANVDLSAYVGTTIVVRFRGVTGSSYRSDMAVDDVSLTVTLGSSCNSNGDCDDLNPCTTDTCVSQVCQYGFAPDTTECRPAAGDCDVAENCTGSSADCPADDVRPDTYECRTTAGVCDVAENCDGVSTDCPADAFEPITTECRADAGDCDVAENCTGSSADCPADGFEPEGTLCLDGLFCNGTETCDAVGDCQAGSYACAANEWCEESADQCVLHGDGDFDGDLDFDLGDFVVFQRCFGQLGIGGCSPGNMIGLDGTIDLDDYAEFAQALGGP